MYEDRLGICVTMTSHDELVGKAVLTREGCLVGVIKKLVTADTKDFQPSVLVVPDKNGDICLSDQGAEKHIVLPLNSISTVRNVAILEREP